MARGDSVKAVLYREGDPRAFAGAWAAWRARGEEAEYVAVSGVRLNARFRPRGVIAVLGAVPIEDPDCHTRYDEVVVLRTGQAGVLDLQREDRGLRTDGRISLVRTAWAWFQGERALPPLLAYLVDEELQLDVMDGREAVLAAAATYPLHFMVWDMLQRDMARLKAEGEAILRHRRGTHWR